MFYSKMRVTTSPQWCGASEGSDCWSRQETHHTAQGGAPVTEALTHLMCTRRPRLTPPALPLPFSLYRVCPMGEALPATVI